MLIDGTDFQLLAASESLIGREYACDYTSLQYTKTRLRSLIRNLNRLRDGLLPFLKWHEKIQYMRYRRGNPCD